MHWKKSLGITICGMATFFLASSAFPYGCLVNPCGGCMSQPCGWYVEGNAGTTHVTTEEDFNFDGARRRNGGCGGFNGNLGYKFMPYFAIEAGYTRYAERKLSFQSTTIAEIDRDMYDIAAKGILPVLDSGFELFAKLGAQRLNAKINPRNNLNSTFTPAFFGIGSSSHSHYDYFIGIGGQYYLWPELAVVVQWQRANGNSTTGTVDLFSIGISFIFGPNSF